MTAEEGVEERATRMAGEKKDDKVKQDLPKLTEQHEGLPGYLDAALPLPPPSPPEGGAGGKGR